LAVAEPLFTAVPSLHAEPFVGWRHAATLCQSIRARLDNAAVVGIRRRPPGRRRNWRSALSPWCLDSTLPTGPRVNYGTPSFPCSPMRACLLRTSRNSSATAAQLPGLSAADPARHPDWTDGDGSALRTRGLGCVVTQLMLSGPLRVAWQSEPASGLGGRYWVRTSDFFGVNPARLSVCPAFTLVGSAGASGPVRCLRSHCQALRQAAQLGTKPPGWGSR